MTLDPLLSFSSFIYGRKSVLAWTHLFCLFGVSLLLLLFWPRGMRDLSSRPGIEPVPPAVEAWSPNHWSAREFPVWSFVCLFVLFCFLFLLLFFKIN